LNWNRSSPSLNFREFTLFLREHFVGLEKLNGKFPKKNGVKHFPKGDFPSDHSEVAISQMCNFHSGNFPKVGLDLFQGAAGCNGERHGWARGANHCG